MSCKFSNNDGRCEFFKDNIERPYDEDGMCLCDDDEDPSESCEDYEER